MKSTWKDHGRVREVELTPLGPTRHRVRVDDADFEVTVDVLSDGRLKLVMDGTTTLAEITRSGARRFVRLGVLEFVIDRDASGRRSAGRAATGSLDAPMPGVVTRVLVAAGDSVSKGQPLLALEAMKMEHLIRAPRDGRIRSISTVAGAMVQGGATLVELEPES